MAKGTSIIVNGNPNGRRIEGIINTDRTPKPGTVMEIVTATEPIDGRYTWQEWGVTAAASNEGVAADGNQRLIAVLLEDDKQGRTETTAYAAGDTCQLYIPLPGDELNMLLQGTAGTEGAVAIGDLFIVDDGTGELVTTTASVESEPFMALETMSEPAADALLHVMYTNY